MAVANPTTQANLLKKLFADKLEKMVYGKSELLTRAKKKTNVGGEDFSFSIRVTPTAGTSNDFTEAQAAQNESQIVKFVVPFRRQFTVMTIDNELIARAKASGNMGAFDDALKNEAQSATESFGEKMSRDAWSEGGGTMGQIHAATVLASTTLRMRVKSDILGINKGQTLEFSTDNGVPSPGAGLLGAPTRLTVVSVNRNTGEATLSANLNTVPGITVNSFVFLRGGYQKGWFGNRGWVPTSDPTSTLWCGQDRTAVDILRTSGVRVPGGGAQMIETLYDAGAEAKINGIETPHFFANPRDLRRLRKEIQTQVQYTGGTQNIGVKPTIDLESGKAELISESWMPEGFAWLGDASDFEVGSAGELPTPAADENGKLFRTKDSADAREGRLVGYGNFRNMNPGKWLAITW